MKSRNRRVAFRKFLAIAFFVLVLAAGAMPQLFGWNKDPYLQTFISTAQIFFGAFAVRVFYFFIAPVIDVSESAEVKDGKFFVTLQSDVDVDVIEPRVFFLVHDRDPSSTHRTTVLRSENVSLGRLPGRIKKAQATVSVAIPDVVINELREHQERRLIVEVTSSERLTNHRSVISHAVDIGLDHQEPKAFEAA